MDAVYKQFKKFMKKFISIILTIATIVSIGAGIFLYQPQEARAVFGIGDINFDIGRFLKENILDGLVKPVARHMMVRLQQEIGRWAQGGFSDENKPFAMTSWKQELQDIANVASGRMINEFGLAPLCAPIKISLGTALKFDAPIGGIIPYTTYAACTIQDVVENVEDFYKNPSISVYGWDSWTALTQPNNNFIGSALLALARKAEITDEEKETLQQELQAGGGVKNETICNETQQEACVARCNELYEPTLPLYGTPNPVYVACIKACDKADMGVCLKETTKKLGSEIKTSVDEAIGSDMKWLITADEITEMLDLVFSGLFNKLINGANGLMTKMFYSSGGNSTKNFDYAYYKNFKKNLTPEDLKKIKTDILKNILDSVKSISKNGYTCAEDEQFVSDVYNEVNAEILDQEAQHLYTSTEGVDLKPDFIVLDSQIAVNNGVARYGVTWDDIPFSKYPEKCASIANSTCKTIATGLPYNLNEDNVNPECTTGCHQRINEYRAQGETDAEAINKAVADGKCSSFAIGNACLQAGYVIDRTKNRCNECIKNYDEICASKTTTKEKEICFKKYCGNYADLNPVSPPITDPADFYNRCEKRETQYNCEVCLKEYFMPADYCAQIYDYISRAYTKYPAIIYANTWYGPLVEFDTEQTGCIDAPDRQGYIPTGLTCRIMPDFKFSNGGTCERYCSNTTADEFKDTTDNKPMDKDCTGPVSGATIGHADWGGVWYAKGRHPGLMWGYYMSVKKIKCCGALSGHDPKRYELCRGAATTEEETPACSYLPNNIAKEPWCYCKEGERPMAFTRTGWTYGGGFGGDCSDESFIGWKKGGDSKIPSISGRKLYMYTNNQPMPTDQYYIGTHSCSENDETWENASGWGIENGTQVASQSHYYISGEVTAPATAICTNKINNTKKTEFQCNNAIGLGGLHLGVYHTALLGLGITPSSTGVHICVSCNENDDGYPYYGYTDKNGNPVNQCQNKN